MRPNHFWHYWVGKTHHQKRQSFAGIQNIGGTGKLEKARRRKERRWAVPSSTPGFSFRSAPLHPPLHSPISNCPYFLKLQRENLSLFLLKFPLSLRESSHGPSTLIGFFKERYFKDLFHFLWAIKQQTRFWDSIVRITFLHLEQTVKILWLNTFDMLQHLF